MPRPPTTGWSRKAGEFTVRLRGTKDGGTFAPETSWWTNQPKEGSRKTRGRSSCRA